MQQRYLGRTGLKVSRLGLGTLTWGRDTDEHEARDQLVSFAEAGGTLVDTAAGYGEGASEELIGSLIGDVVRRDDLVHRHEGRGSAGAAGTRGDQRVARLPAAHPRRLAEAARRGPRRPVAGAHLGRRRPARGDPLGPGPRGGDRQGGVRRHLQLLRLAVGAGRDLAAGGARPRAARLDPGGVLPGQPPGRDARCSPAAEALGLGVLPWSPLGRGVLTGKYRHGTPADSRAASPTSRTSSAPTAASGTPGIVEAVVRAAEGLGLVAAERRVTWVHDRPGVDRSDRRGPDGGPAPGLADRGGVRAAAAE